MKEVPDDIWFQSFKNSSWGMADVISHFIIWDDFVMKYRMPYFVSTQSVPHFPTDVEEMNKSAIIYARSGIPREKLINQFIYTRKQLVDEIERIPADNFYNDFQIGTKKVMLNHYFSSLIQHDLKHKEEIIQFLIHNKV
ncbi:hypothetical protein ACTFOB_00590 [Bacillus cereus group sp. MYBK79-1]|uniref:hypothetical protein n=1 Tax=unclassified Bacillus cereus group TaxID=2750818 RepID=UPI003F7ABEA3